LLPGIGRRVDRVFMTRTTSRLATALLGLAMVLPAAGASGSVTATTASLDGNSFSEFTQTNALNGTLATTSTRAWSGSYSARATYSGGGDNGYSRGIWNVQWEEGDDVWFGAAYYLPAGFHANIQGQVDLVRWDNWLSHPNDTDWGGVSIYGSDHRARLLRFGAGRPNDTLVGPFDLPEGRWFTLEVHQLRSSTAGNALSELYLDGTLVGRSTAANTYGRSATRIRYGVVAIAAGSQTKALELNFDSASMGGASAFGAQQTQAPEEPAADAESSSEPPVEETAPEPTPEPEATPETEPVPTESEPRPKKGRGHDHLKTTRRARPGLATASRRHRRHRARHCSGKRQRRAGNTKRSCARRRVDRRAQDSARSRGTTRSSVQSR